MSPLLRIIPGPICPRREADTRARNDFSTMLWTHARNVVLVVDNPIYIMCSQISINTYCTMCARWRWASKYTAAAQRRAACARDGNLKQIQNILIDHRPTHLTRNVQPLQIVGSKKKIGRPRYVLTARATPSDDARCAERARTGVPASDAKHVLINHNNFFSPPFHLMHRSLFAHV